MLCLSKSCCILVYLYTSTGGSLIQAKFHRNAHLTICHQFSEVCMSNMLVYFSTSLLDHSITFVCVGSYLQYLKTSEHANWAQPSIEQFQNHGNQKLRLGHTQFAMFLYQTVSCCKLNSSLNSCQDLLIRK